MSHVIARRVRLSRRTLLKGLTLAGTPITVGLPPLVSMFNGAGTAYAAEPAAAVRKEAPIESRVELLHNVLGSSSTKVNPIAVDLLAKTVELLQGQPAEDAVLVLAEVAVARRGEVIAHVKAAVDLTDAQQERLTQVLSRIYGHPVKAQMQIDPELLGGLAISVGDEVIDGTLSSRLAAAQNQMPD